MDMKKDIQDLLNQKIGKVVGSIKPEVVKTEASLVDRFRAINNIQIDLTKDAIIRKFGNEQITIIPLSDIHIGNKGCNIEKFEQTLKFIMETPNCYTILLGDQTETATKTSVGLGLFDEDFDIEEQMKLMARSLRPLAKEGKILGMLTGNHEMRISYMAKLNPAKMIAEELGIPYFGYQGYISLHVGTQIYHIFCHHGVSSATGPAGKINAIRQLNKIARADIYLSGHTHARVYDSDIIYQINDETGKVDSIICHYLACGSFVEYWGTYPEMKLLPPASTGTVMMRLSPTVKDVQIIL
jgi:predicted phosphodiesterase